jgi:hypothetical protein
MLQYINLTDAWHEINIKHKITLRLFDMQPEFSVLTVNIVEQNPQIRGIVRRTATIATN